MVLLGMFALLFLLTFGVVCLGMRPSRNEQALQKRLEAVISPERATPDGAHARPMLRELNKQKQNKGVAWLLQLRVVLSFAELVYQSTGSRRLLPTLLLVAGLAVAAFAGVFVSVHMLAVAVLAGVLGGALPLVRLRYVRQKRLIAFNKALPDSIDICARALRAGHSLVAAMGIASEQAPEPAKTEFLNIFKKQNFGLPLREALLESMEKYPSEDFRVFITGILVQKDTGGNLTEIFDRIVLVMRERLRIEGEIRIHTAQGRMTAWILTLLPPVLFVFINTVNPGYSKPMFAESLGRTLFYFGVVSLAIGGLVVRRIVNGIEV